MTDRPTTYRGWNISYGGPWPEPAVMFAHDGYDGAEDAHDDRCGTADTVEEAKESIDEYWEERALNTVDFNRAWDEIVDGWLLISDFDDVTDRIERLAKLMRDNGVTLEHLDERQRGTSRMMIERQIGMGVMRGDFADCGLPAGTVTKRSRYTDQIYFLPPKAPDEGG